MKKAVFIIPLLASLLVSPLINNRNYKEVRGIGSYRIHTNGSPTQLSSLPKTIDLNPVDEIEIRNYYSSLNGLSDSERQGTNLLKNLKTILYDMNYFKYGGMSNGGVTHIYAITDRDWEHSPVSTIKGGTYDETTNQITEMNYSTEISNDPYVKMLYVDYTKQETTPFKKPDKPSDPNFDKEHVWCQSRGFKGKDETATGPAGTDLHHLIAGDSQVNQSIHNDNPYGFVETVSATGNKSYTSNNKVGSNLHKSPDDTTNVVFEPQDCDKGDIARAIFYMAARYNNFAGDDTITDFEPNLVLSNHTTGTGKAEYSTATKPVDIGILSDLLAWNKIDPVDEYEIHRNDLIYRNYQGNRNPFIDFPEWADYIWGTVDDDGTNYNPTVSKAANPQSDALNDADLVVSASSLTIELEKSKTLRATTLDGSDITWTIGSEKIIELSKTVSSSGEEIKVTALKTGKTSIIVKATVDGNEVEKTVNISIIEVPKKNYVPYILAGAGIVVILIIVAIIYVESNKRNKKKIKNAAKKTVKKIVKSSNSGKRKK